MLKRLLGLLFSLTAMAGAEAAEGLPACGGQSLGEVVLIKLSTPETPVTILRVPENYIHVPPNFLGGPPKGPERSGIVLIAVWPSLCPDKNMGFYEEGRTDKLRLSLSPANNWFVLKLWGVEKKYYKPAPTSEIELEKYVLDEETRPGWPPPKFTYLYAGDPEAHIHPARIRCTPAAAGTFCSLLSQVTENLAFSVDFRFERISEWRTIYEKNRAFVLALMDSQ